MEPEGVLYHKGHGWVRKAEGKVVCGITDYAQRELGEVLYIELPDTGTAITAGEPYGSIESAKSGSDLVAPLSGVITAVNEETVYAPERVNDDPYGEGWLIELAPAEDSGEADLISAEEYGKSYC